MKTPSFRSALQALLAAALFGISAPLAKLLLGQVEPVPLAALLYLGCGLGAAIFQLLPGVRREEEREAGLKRTDLPWMLGAVFAGGVLAPILLLIGLRTTPASTSALLLNFESAATTLLAGLIFKEAIGKRAAWAVGLITLASILLSWDFSGQWGLSGGAIAILAACLLWGVDNNCTRNISARSPLTIVMVKGLGAGSFNLLLALVLNMPLPGWRASLPGLALGMVSYGFSIALFVLAMRGLGAARTSALFGSAPFIGAIFAALLFRETPQALALISIPLLLAGAGLLLSEEHGHEHSHSEVHEHRHNHHDQHHTHIHEDGFSGEHSHPHEHNLRHSHAHLPDLHHRHLHEEGEPRAAA